MDDNPRMPYALRFVRRRCPTLNKGELEEAARTTQDARSPTQIKDDLAKHFAATRVFKTIDDVLKEFIDELRQI